MRHLTRRQFGLTASGLLVGARTAGLRAAPPPPLDIPVGLVTGLVALNGPQYGDSTGAHVPDHAMRAEQKHVAASLREGVEFAVSEINAKGGILNRKLRLIVAELDAAERDTRRQAIEIARRLVAEPGLVSVIGHVSPEDALPASITYSEHGILFIAPTITLGDLNGHGLANVFATIPDNKQIGKQTAIFAYGQGSYRIAVLRDRGPESEEATLSFLDQVGVLGMTETAQKSYPPGRKDFRDLLADLRAKPFDTLFIAAPAEDAVLIIRQSIEMQINATFVIGGLRDLPVLISNLRTLPANIFVPVLEDASVHTQAQNAFIERFRGEAGRESDDWTWQGYDAVGLLQAAILQTQSFEPQALMATLRYAIAWSGLMGRYSFERNGRIYTRAIAFAQLKNDELTYFSLSS